MAENNGMFGIDPKSKVVETSELQIRGHLLRWSDTVIQLSNISMVSTTELPVPRFPAFAILAAIAGCVLLAMDSRSYYHDETLQMLGCVGIGVSIALIILWAIACGANKGKTYLNLALNSGTVYSFLFTNKEFMRQVLQVFANIFESGAKSDTNILINAYGNEIRENGAVVTFVKH
ncbi:MAG: hypothetical protein IJQ25_09545 [Oscillibacter sp.]|nr:hypothetical protein [Oscillibacter sp.]